MKVVLQKNCATNYSERELSTRHGDFTHNPSSDHVTAYELLDGGALISGVRRLHILKRVFCRTHVSELQMSRWNVCQWQLASTLEIIYMSL